MDEAVLNKTQKNAANRPSNRQRSKSLFGGERPNLAETDRGVFVVSHADFPKKRTLSEPLEPESVLLKPMLAYEGKIRKIIHDVFENALAVKSYSFKEFNSMGTELAAKIKHKVSELPLTHYKLVCTCILTKRVGPGPVVESGCVWNVRSSSVDHDALVELTYKSQAVYAIGTVYGIYDTKFEKAVGFKGSVGRPSPIPE